MHASDVSTVLKDGGFVCGSRFAEPSRIVPREVASAGVVSGVAVHLLVHRSVCLRVGLNDGDEPIRLGLHAGCQSGVGGRRRGVGAGCDSGGELRKERLRDARDGDAASFPKDVERVVDDFGCGEGAEEPRVAAVAPAGFDC